MVTPRTLRKPVRRTCALAVCIAGMSLLPGCYVFRAESVASSRSILTPSGLTFTLAEHAVKDLIVAGRAGDFRRVTAEFQTDDGGGISRVLAETNCDARIDLGPLDLLATPDGRQMWVAKRPGGELVAAFNLDTLELTGLNVTPAWLTDAVRASAKNIGDVTIQR